MTADIDRNNLTIIQPVNQPISQSNPARQAPATGGKIKGKRKKSKMPMWIAANPRNGRQVRE